MDKDSTTTPMPIFTLQIICSRQTGFTPQNNSLDHVLGWSAAMTPAQGLKMIEEVKRVLAWYTTAAFRPPSTSAAKALAALRGKSIAALEVCEAPHE